MQDSLIGKEKTEIKWERRLFAGIVVHISSMDFLILISII
jgi:hypothetical protein